MMSTDQSYMVDNDKQAKKHQPNIKHQTIAKLANHDAIL